MSRLALLVCVAVCGLLAIVNAELWHVESWMPLGAAAALAFMFSIAERGRRRGVPIRVAAPRQTGEGWPEQSFAADTHDDELLDVSRQHGSPIMAIEDSR